MTAATRQIENQFSARTILTASQPPEHSVDGRQERATEYKKRISDIMRDFDQRVGTEIILKRYFREHAKITRLQGPVRPERPTRRRQIEDPVYVNGYIATKEETPIANLSIPPKGIFVGFIEGRSHTIPEKVGDKIIERHVLVPQHWGVISIDNLQHQPYAMDSRLTGRPTSPIASADNLRLHEGLDPARAGWEVACQELHAYLSQGQVVRQAREVLGTGIFKQVTRALTISL